MARVPRPDVPHVPQHIVQRGNNRMRCFVERPDYETYLHFLAEYAKVAAVRIHAYTLMTNHVHLLATADQSGVLSRFMHGLGRRYAWYFNRRYERTGSLFEHPFKSNLVDTEPYMLCCYRYIELNPVRAGIVDEPAKYPWSSYRHNALGEDSSWICPHSVLTGLGRTPEEWRDAYRGMVQEGLSAEEIDSVRARLNKGPGRPKPK